MKILHVSNIITNMLSLRLSEDGTSEEPFFQTMNSSDIWIQFKKWMFFDKKKSNFYNYEDGDAAASNGYINLILQRPDLKFTHLAIDFAADNGHLNIIQHLTFNTNIKTEWDIGCISPALYLATIKGHIEVVEFLYNEDDNKHCCKCFRRQCARKHLQQCFGHSHFINKLYCTEDLMTQAIEHGHFGLVKFFYSKGTECGILHVHLACIKGNLDIVKFIYYEDMLDFPSYCIDAAAAHGHLAVLQFIIDNNIVECTIEELAEFTSHAFDVAACNGYFDVVVYLHNIGAHCTEIAMEKAIRNKRFNIIEFLLKNRSEVSLRKALRLAMYQQYLDVIELLLKDKDKIILQSILDYMTNLNRRIIGKVRDNFERGNIFEFVANLDIDN